ncbi:unnamed protein product [Allacma fusca]|uniref:Uncharacterized protein n=1 Tax=Allacma fusca TaxID=39272 RepID=A0A8J2L2K8_9HEXA|nr:unnamed protein product [Allacma fusca]
MGGHVGGVPIVNRGQVARRGRRRPVHGRISVTSTVNQSGCEAVGGAEDRAGEGADVAEAVGGPKDGPGEGAEAAFFVGSGLDVVEVEGADVGAAAVLGADVEGFVAGRAEAAGGDEVGANAVVGAEVDAEVGRDVHTCTQWGRSA